MKKGLDHAFTGINGSIMLFTHQAHPLATTALGKKEPCEETVYCANPQKRSKWLSARGYIIIIHLVMTTHRCVFLLNKHFWFDLAVTVSANSVANAPPNPKQSSLNSTVFN